MFFTYHGYSFAVKLWNWAFDMGKAAFGSPGDSFKNLVRALGDIGDDAHEKMQHIKKIDDVNYQYIKELQRKYPERGLFPVITKLGPIPQFLWWCFGNKCTGGGDCQYQYSKWECNSFTGEASCQDKSGKQSLL